MRALLVISVLAAVLVPAIAQDARLYVNESYGFQVALPAGLVNRYEDSETQVWTSADGTREIALFGGRSLDPLEALAQRYMGYDQDDGWTTRLLSSTPSWVAYTGARNGMITAVRLIEICPRWQYARLQVTYPERDAVAIADMLDLLAASFRSTGTAQCPGTN